MKSILIVKLGALGDIYDTVIYLTDLSRKCDVTFVVHERFAGPLQYLCNDIRLIKLKPASPISYVPLIKVFRKHILVWWQKNNFFWIHSKAILLSLLFILCIFSKKKLHGEEN